MIVLAVATGIAAAAPDDRLYRAHIAAAAAHLRLQETGAARSWLDEAPVASRHWEWRYLDAASDLSRATLTGHEGGVEAAPIGDVGQGERPALPLKRSVDG